MAPSEYAQNVIAALQCIADRLERIEQQLAWANEYYFKKLKQIQQDEEILSIARPTDNYAPRRYR
jgi:hypothetical protein